MKKLYMLMLFLVIGKSFGQLQNANWYFGKNAALNFGTNPPTVLLNSNMDQNEGCASVSTAGGNLLFYTDGVNVWNHEHTIMPNSFDLTGHLSSAQSAVIVPSLVDNNQYYIFTTPADWAIMTNSFAYSVVDMNLDDSKGDIVTNQKNIPLLDENGLPFTIKTEGLTVASNHDGTGYWVLYPNNNRLYAYLVDASGVNTTPVVSDMTFTNDQNSSNSTLTCVKVSPNNDRIAISFASFATPPAQINQSLSQTRIYNFNSALGTISENTYEVQINGRSIYSFEFSPNNNLLFLNNSQYTLPNPRLMVYDLVNLNLREEAIGTGLGLGSFQRAPNNEIYVSGQGSQKLHRITNPNDYLSSITYDVININPLVGTRRTTLGLPQLVLELNPLACTEDIVLNTETHRYFTYEVSNEITTQSYYHIGGRHDIVQYAGNLISLEDGTHIAAGARYLGKIQPCNSLEAMARPGVEEPVKKVYNFEDEIYTERLVVFPNPVHDIVNIAFRDLKMNTILVQSLDGRTILSKDVNGVNAYELDFADYQTGIYIISVETSDGRIHSEKLIKN